MPEMYPRTEADKIAEQNTREFITKRDGVAPENIRDDMANVAVEAAKRLWVPSEGSHAEIVKVGGEDLLVTDRRRFTPESVEKDFQERNEILRQPLNDDEFVEFSKRARMYINSDKDNRIKSGEPRHSDAIYDLDGDIAAFGRVDQIFRGDEINRGNDAKNKKNGLGPAERLEDLIDYYRGYGAVDKKTGEIRYAGYEGSLLYAFARAKQILDKLSTDPKSAREKVLNTEEPDFKWLLDEPVVDEKFHKDIVTDQVA